MAHQPGVQDPLQFPLQENEGDDIQLFEEVPQLGESPTAQHDDGSPQRSRFAFDARIDSSVALADDPLGGSGFSGGGGDDPLSADPLSLAAARSDPLAGADPLSSLAGGCDGDGGSEAEVPLHDEEGEEGGTTLIDTFASYGQLLTDDYARNGSRFGERPFDEEDEEEVHEVAFQRRQSEGGTASGAAAAPQQQQQPRRRDAGGLPGSPPPPQHATREGASRPQAPAAPSRRRISVSDPIKKVEGGLFPGMKSGYVLYRVDTEDAKRGTHTSVRRRFRDFVSLADMLKSSHRGYFLPPRPEKQPNPLESQVPDSEFVATRCAALQTWLGRLSAHPVIGHSQELRLFLEKEGQLGGDPEWGHLGPAPGGVLDGLHRLPRQLLGAESAVPSAAEAARSTRATGDLLRRIKEQTTSMKHHPPPSEAELDLVAKKERLEEWSAVLADASRRAEHLALAFEDLGARTGDVGMSLIRLGRFQDEDAPGRPGRYTPAGAANASLAAHAIKTGKAAVVVARVAKAAAGPVTDALAPLHEALALAPAAGKALRQREEALLSTQALRDEADTKADAVAQLEAEGSKTYGTHYGKTRKAAALSEEVKALQAAGVAAQAEYERELERWQTMRAEDFARMLAGLAIVQHAFHKRTAGVWQAVAADLSESAGGSGGGGSTSAGAGLSGR